MYQSKVNYQSIVDEPTDYVQKTKKLVKSDPVGYIPVDRANGEQNVAKDSIQKNKVQKKQVHDTRNESTSNPPESDLSHASILCFCCWV